MPSRRCWYASRRSRTEDVCIRHVGDRETGGPIEEFGGVFILVALVLIVSVVIYFAAKVLS